MESLKNVNVARSTGRIAQAARTAKHCGSAVVEFALIIVLIVFVYYIVQSTIHNPNQDRVCAAHPERCVTIEWSVK